MFRILVGNMRHVLGDDADPRELHRTARRAFAHAGKTYFDFYRALTKPTDDVRHVVDLPTGFLDLLGSETAKGCGVLILATHMSNFDLASISLGAAGYHCQALSLSDPPGGFTILNRVRQKAGHEITPITPASLRKAILRLRGGGIVASGAERPVYTDGVTVPLFGSPAYVPWGSAKLALLTGATVIVVACAWERKRGYFLQTSEPLEMVASGNRQEDIRLNTERIVDVAETYIRERPEQWLMFYPMWPDVVPDDPRHWGALG